MRSSRAACACTTPSLPHKRSYILCRAAVSCRTVLRSPRYRSTCCDFKALSRVLFRITLYCLGSASKNRFKSYGTCSFLSCLGRCVYRCVQPGNSRSCSHGQIGTGCNAADKPGGLLILARNARMEPCRKHSFARRCGQNCTWGVGLGEADRRANRCCHSHCMRSLIQSSPLLEYPDSGEASISRANHRI